MKLSFGIAFALISAMSVSAYPAEQPSGGEVSITSTPAHVAVPVEYQAEPEDEDIWERDGDFEDWDEMDGSGEGQDDSGGHSLEKRLPIGQAVLIGGRYVTVGVGKVLWSDVKEFVNDATLGNSNNPKSVIGKGIKICEKKMCNVPSTSPAMQRKLAGDVQAYAKACNLAAKGSCPTAVDVKKSICIGFTGSECTSALAHAKKTMQQQTLAAKKKGKGTAVDAALKEGSRSRGGGAPAYAGDRTTRPAKGTKVRGESKSQGHADARTKSKNTNAHKVQAAKALKDKKAKARKGKSSGRRKGSTRQRV